VIRRAALLAEGNEITLKALPLEMSTYKLSYETPNHYTQHHQPSSHAAEVPEVKEPRHDLKNAALEAEYETIIRVLREVNFNKTKAAEILNIDRKTLYNKMKAINLK
jgi:two-component system response regulator HydG